MKDKLQHKHLLVVAYLFPPWGGGGVQRSLGFVRHLDPLGWRCTVLAAGADARYWAHDPSLVDRIPASCRVVRVERTGIGKALHQFRNLPIGPARRVFDAAVSWPDRENTWLPAARRVAHQVIREEPVHAIFSTGSPWTDHLVPLSLDERPVPWIADFRDPWTDNRLAKFVTPFHKKAMRSLERRVHRAAQHRLVTSDETKTQMQASFPEGGPIHTIFNGYDDEDFENLARPNEDGKLRLTVAGSFYPGHQPTDFYRLVADLLKQQPAWRNRIELHFYGKTNQRELLRDYGLDDVATEHGYVPQAEAMAALARSHINWLVLPPEPSPSPFVPQRLFAYLRLGRPILAHLPRGAAQEILSAAGGTSLNLNGGVEPLALGRWLQRVAEDRRATAGFDPEVVGRFNRKTLAKRLAELLEA